MQHHIYKRDSKPPPQHNCSCCDFSQPSTKGMSRRHFLGGLAVVSAISGLKLTAIAETSGISKKSASSEIALPPGKTLRVKPVLT